MAKIHNPENGAEIEAGSGHPGLKVGETAEVSIEVAKMMQERWGFLQRPDVPPVEPEPRAPLAAQVAEVKVEEPKKAGRPKKGTK
jgi:hypothetical protein